MVNLGDETELSSKVGRSSDKAHRANLEDYPLVFQELKLWVLRCWV